MKRHIYKELLEWKDSDTRKPLILYGARQVGKTYILKELGRREFKNLVYIDCFGNDKVREIFTQHRQIPRIIAALSAYAGQPIVAGRTLLLFDEVQEIPRVVTMLKYFCEDMRELHVAVAGSLLGVMNMQGESFPVGKVDILHLYPMTYEEFLEATGHGMLADLLHNPDRTLYTPLHREYVELLRQYYYVGGMPEAVSLMVKSHDVLGVRDVQNAILSTYEADIAKHSGREAQRIRLVWQSIPSQLARENKKFVYGAVRKGARAADFEIAIQWLVDAGLAYKVYRTRDVKAPLLFYRDFNAFKLYIIDVGLLGALTGASPSDMLIGDNAFTEYKGAFTENFVLQQLVTVPWLVLSYWNKVNSTQEVDFVVQTPERIVPVEVKAEVNVKSKSLQALVTHDFASYHLKGLRLSMLPYVDQGWMENVPLYATTAFFNTNRQ